MRTIAAPWIGSSTGKKFDELMKKFGDRREMRKNSNIYRNTWVLVERLKSVNKRKYRETQN